MYAERFDNKRTVRCPLDDGASMNTGALCKLPPRHSPTASSFRRVLDCLSAEQESPAVELSVVSTPLHFVGELHRQKYYWRALAL